MWPLPNRCRESMIDAVMGWLATAILATLTALWGLLEQTAFTSPDVTTLPQVVTISGRSQMIVNTAFVLAIIAVGVTVMTHETVQVRYGVGELAAAPGGRVHRRQLRHPDLRQAHRDGQRADRGVDRRRHRHRQAPSTRCSASCETP